MTSIQEDVIQSNLDDKKLLEGEIADKIFAEYEGTNMKSDEDLFEEVLAGKESSSKTESSLVSKV